ncbi:hypothetical protein M409DRAFT_26899 [Zasmidium cellare ATCC 36951]|uniref:HIT-type domain-containing protein n=1 Tax=Zasmidium cellare ATCC 36951 TaxID=1080233 RepID=A0A6A6C6H7_ZASCE|nr:uncharacterized protein M409DRAFT_26899 [Zasmidium cellare ATCC 36951]KAF2162661.1 hypothetical protein M409DRAFT_26899 [Zasmidium cellare ATCC 36951]
MSLLSELCSICYVEKPKYRCPRCKTGTCSLPCYKRHQQRASCNGQRDPAEYLKKSQLATPEGIDRDFNYLKGVERDMDNAHRDTRDRGIGSSQPVTRTAYRGNNPEGKLQRYLGKNRITIARAPKGMSRQKSNQTRSTKRDHIMWTVEWIDSDGKSELQHNCVETNTIEDTFSASPTEKLRNPDASTMSKTREKKRKRQESQLEAGLVEGHPLASLLGLAADIGATSAAQNDTASAVGRPEESSNLIETIPEPQQEEKPKPERFYYLLKVGTSSACKVLIPLMPNCTLTESLQDQTVMEYPTYYVLPYSPGKLPPGFRTEHQYLKIRKGEEEEFDEALIKAEEGGVLNGGIKNEPGLPSKPSFSSKSNFSSKPTHVDSRPTQVDANKILDMLKRDVTR